MTQYQISDVAQRVYARAAYPGKGQPIVVSNNDNSFTLYADDNQSVTPQSDQIGPQSSLSFDGSRDIWLSSLNPDVTINAQVVRGGTQWTASPGAIAEALVASGFAGILADATAQAMAAGGIPIIGAPVQLYDLTGAVSGNTVTIPVGNTIPPLALKTGCYDAGLTQAQADTTFCQIVSRGLDNNTHLVITKKFWTESNWDTSQNDLANYASFGTIVIFCLKPAYPPTTADKTNLANFLAAIQGMGFSAANSIIVLWQEPNDLSNNMTPSDYQAMLEYYGPTVNASGLPLVANIGSGQGDTVILEYGNAAINALNAGVKLAGLAQDFYLYNWLNGATMDGLINLAATNHLAYGLFEHGCRPSDGEQNCIDFMNYVREKLLGVLAAGNTLLAALYFDGDCSSTGSGSLSSPIGQDPSTPSPDFRIALFQQLYDELVVTQSSVLTLPAGKYTVITPVNPSPVAGFASADYLSYEIVMGLEAGTGSTIPFASVYISWYDYDQVTQEQIPVDTVRIVVPMGANGDPNGPAVITGRGPMRGGYMRIEIHNQDTVNASLAYLQGAGTSRTIHKDNWSWDIEKSPAIPGYTLGSGGDHSLVIGRIVSQTIPAGSSFSAMYGLSAGEVYLREHVSGLTTDQCEFDIQVLPPTLWGAQDIHRAFLGATTENEIIIALPRAPILMTITNNSTSQATVDMSMIAIQ
jgi:hypothetical protein